MEGPRIPEIGSICWLRYDEISCYWPVRIESFTEQKLYEKVTVTTVPVERCEYDIAETKKLRFPFLAYFKDFAQRKPGEHSRERSRHEIAVESAIRQTLLERGVLQEAIDLVSRKRSYDIRIQEYQKLVEIAATPGDLEKLKGRKARSAELADNGKKKAEPSAP